MRSPLPIDPFLPRLLESLERHPSLVLKAAPGTGKTTRVPPALLKAGFFAEGAGGPQPEGAREILVLEPRRLAAKHSARRVAEELGEAVGKTVGYQFRFENVTSRATRLRFLTEGMLMRRIVGEAGRRPLSSLGFAQARVLESVAAVVLDEFHERHLHTDSALAWLRQLQRGPRPDLRLLVMSATLDSEPIARYLGDCPVIEVENRLHPVELRYLAEPSRRHLDQLVRDSALRLKDSMEGDILVFLPGMAEIRRAQGALEEALGRDRSVEVLPLHGELSREEQDRAILRSDRRRIILSTNVAETSLTIEGVRAVIDSGLHRLAAYSWWSGVPSLRTRPISRASATQRAGRAGRTGPGVCVRLYTQGDFEARVPFEVPEIQRADLAQVLLELKAAALPGAEDPGALPWFEAPSTTALQAAWQLLHRLGALDAPAGRAGLTELGRRLAALPTHPRLGRFLLEAERREVLAKAATLAAEIAEGSSGTQGALEDPVERVLEAGLRPGGGETFRRARAQLLDALGAQGKSMAPPSPVGSPTSPEEEARRLRFALLTGFPDRVARKRKPTGSATGLETELVFCMGGSARAEDSGALSGSELFVVLDAQELQRQGQARAELKLRSVTPILAEWLFDLEPTAVAEKDEHVWNAGRGRVERRSQLVYDQLVLTESVEPATPGPESARVLLGHGLGLDLGVLSTGNRETATQALVEKLGPLAEPDRIAGTLARLFHLDKHLPGKLRPLPEALEALGQVLAGSGGLAALKEIDWPRALLEAFLDTPEDPGLVARIEQWLPEAIQLPGGRRARVHYEALKAPWIESRLQDFFGMRRTPALLDGRIPLTVHLLAPNQRSLQITTDLQGFWEREYPSLRNALARRYPRHAWPEDPLTAKPPPPRR